MTTTAFSWIPECLFIYLQFVSLYDTTLWILYRCLLIFVLSVEWLYLLKQLKVVWPMFFECLQHWDGSVFLPVARILCVFKSSETNEPDFAAQQHAHAPNSMLHSLQQALLDSKKENQEVAAENAALRQQLTRKEISWEKERKKLLKLLRGINKEIVFKIEDIGRKTKTIKIHLSPWTKWFIANKDTETNKLA